MPKEHSQKSKVWESIDVIARNVAGGTASAVANVQKSLDRIAELDPEYNAIITTLEDSARARAKDIDTVIAAGKPAGRLAGVPFIAKDNFLVFGADTTAASNMLKGFRAPYQATAIEKLEAEGAICVAKANLDAFAHGASTENSDFFITKNPHDVTRVAGGSSGGSAAAIALEMAPFALGTDTGGSIRQPASFCGVVGYKPTYGLVSRSGVVAMASSTDVIGPLTQTVEDASLVLDVMAGKDARDGTTIERQKTYIDLEKTIAGKKIGVVSEYFSEGLDPGVAKVIQDAVNDIEKAGGIVEKVSMPSMLLALAVYYIVVPAEVSSNLGRYDGQRYQHSAEDTTSLEESYKKSRSEGFGVEAKRRIMVGTHVLSSGYYDAYYTKAQTVRTKIINECTDAFETYDFLIGPVAPTPAFTIGENEDPVQMYLQDIYSAAANIVGLPAISVPYGSSNGLPVGLQIIAPQKKDAELLGFAAAIKGLTS